MADELPKDYSSLYREDNAPIVPTRTNIKSNWSDGVRSKPIHRESTVDLAAVVRKLKHLPQANQAYAIGALNTHYKSIFVKKKFKASIEYHDENATYVVHLDENTLRAVKAKAPRHENLRYFFEQPDKTREEIENDDLPVPFIERDGANVIVCKVFPSN